MYLKISLTDSVETRWTYTGSVIQGFETLTKKLDKHSHPKTPATLSVNELNSNDFLFNHMRPIVLATLHDHLTTLSLALNPLDLCNDPNSKVKLILELQSGLDHNITQLKYIIHFYRINELRSKVNDVAFRISESFHFVNLHIYKTRLSADPPEEENGEGAREKSIQEALDVMKWTITWFDGLESDIVEDHWRISTFRIDNLLHELLILVDPTVYPTHHSINEKRRFVLQPVIELTKSLITIIKLCRLFFKKLSQQGMNKKQLPLHTDMNSKQIKCLCELAEDVYADFLEIVLLFLDVETAETVPSRHMIKRHMIKIAERVANRFEAPWLLVLLHLVPLIPDTGGRSEQSYYKEWFTTWHTQIIVALHNFDRLATMLDYIHF
ncbi:hypothetical protein PSTG_11977 [Puccinia striiformis f. sp. tritici PST-78]|uniref:Uncharacterized protein n=2 Tax=Puccinia striiformis f. sp. tritici TaxID=168172 RepID=A0A0L0V603_9BASI|nr:hypothetical protein PSTG_11977 [Puccinia striiformis f. sp. tritici PST-78]